MNRFTCFTSIAITTLLLVGCENSNSPDQVRGPSASSSGGEADPHAGHDHADHDHAHHEDEHAAQPDAPVANNTANNPGSGGASRVSAADFSFTIPEGWTQQPASNAMRVTELVAPAPKPGTSAPVAAFSLAGGDIDANITRWEGQFSDADPVRSREKIQRAGTTIHLVEMAGAYRGMGGMGSGAAAEGTVMRAAIIERPGQPNLFIKMTGSAEAMNPLAEAWTAMIDSITTP